MDVDATYQKHCNGHPIQSVLNQFSREMEYVGVMKKSPKWQSTLINEEQNKKVYLTLDIDVIEGWICHGGN